MSAHYERQRNINRRLHEKLRRKQTVHNVAINEIVPRVNVATIAELLNYFDGKSELFETWERQVIFLKNTYRLSDDLTKIMIGTRLKGKALSWFHSRSEHVTMPVNELLWHLKEMFHRRPGKMLLRKQFEQRMWKREETFSEYLHEKLILANYIAIDEDEAMEYVIEGIPDSMLRDQARVQRLRTKGDLLEAFENITLRGRSTYNDAYPKSDNRAKKPGNKTHEKRETPKTVMRSQLRFARSLCVRLSDEE